MEDCRRVWIGESDGGDVDNGEERIVVGLFAVRGEDEGVVRVVDVERNELLLPNENQEPERVTVEMEDELLDDALETESAVDARKARAATDFFTFITGSGTASWPFKPFSSSLTGSSRIASSSACCLSRRI